MSGLTIGEMQVGHVARYSKLIGEQDVSDFAEISGDRNPIHIDAEYAKQTLFKQRIAHGALLVGLISKILGMDYPGPGAIYLSQSLAFKKPCFLRDTITAEVELTQIIIEKNIAKFVTRCVNQDGHIVAIGESVVMPRK